MESFDLTPRCEHSSWKTFDANCGPRSEIIIFGNPNRLNTLSRYSFAVPIASIVLVHGIMATPLVTSWSTTTMRELNPLDSGRAVIKSMVMV